MDEQQVKQKMQFAVDATIKDVTSIRTGRVTASLVEDIMIPAYGGTQRLKVMELASITASDPQTLVIDPWDKSIIGDIRKGILEANVGLNPASGDNVLRITLSPMTSEDREKYVKLLSVKLENGRVMVRQIRGDSMHEIKKSYEGKEITEDEKFGQEKRLQELTDEFITKIETAGNIKKQELLNVQGF